MAITTRNSILTNKGKGKGIQIPLICAATQAGTAPAAASGFAPVSITFNAIGTTLPSTIQGFPLPAGLPNELFANLLEVNYATNGATKSIHLAYFYKMGTLDLANAATPPYDGFTHDAGWSGTLRRTVLGAANTDISLIPLLHITTATATSAPAFILKTTAGGAGYKNQAGSSIVGTKTFTLPGAITAQGSAYILRVEDEDSAIQDMTQMSVTTKGSAGAATVYGVEILASAPGLLSFQGVSDQLFGGLNMCNLAPAVPSTGSVTAYLGLITFSGTVAAITISGSINAVLNG